MAALRKGGSCAIITNSCINFVIYCFVGRTFRRRFISTFSWAANSNWLGGNIAENGGETFPSPGTNNREIPDNNTKSAQDKYETEENPLRNVVKTQGNPGENSLVSIAGQSQENLVNLQKILMNPEESLRKPGESKAEDGVSLEDPFQKWRPDRLQVGS